MHRRYNLAHFILASVVALSLTPLMVDAASQAQIAFTSERDGNREIYVMDANGTNQRKLTNSPLVDWDLSWSPDGRHIAFTSNRDGNLEIYVMDADGRRDPRRLTKNHHDDTDPAWFDPAFAFAVGPAGKTLTMWGWLKQVNR